MADGVVSIEAVKKPILNPDVLPASDSLARSEAGIRETSDELDRLRNIEQATWLDIEGSSVSIGEKAKGLSNTWDDTWLARGIDYFKYDRSMWRTKDEAFIESFDDDAKLSFMNQNNLTLNDINTIGEAVNLEHAQDLADMINQKREKERQIANSLNDYGGIMTERVMSSVATSFLDIDTPIAGAFGIGAKITKANTIMSAGAGATHLGYGAFMAETQEDISWGEAAVFSLLGAAIDSAIIYKLNPSDANTLMRIADEAPSNDVVTDMVSKQESLRERVSARLGEDEVTPNVRNQKMSELIDELDSDKPDINKIDAIQKEIDELDNIGKEKPSKLKETVPERNRIENLKNEIKNRINVMKSDGYKVIKEKLAKLENSPRAKQLETEIAEVKQEAKDFIDVSERIERDIALIKKDLEALAVADKEGLASEFLELYRDLHKRGYLSKSAIDQLEYSYKKGIGEGYQKPKIEFSAKGMDGGDVKINGKKVGKLPYALGAALVGTSAMAYDMEDVPSDLGAIIVLGILGLGVGSNYKKLASMARGINTTKVASEVLGRTKSTRAKISDMAMKSRTSLTETLQPLLKDASPEFKKLVNDIYFNPIDGKPTVERRKNAIFHTHYLGLQRDTHDFYKEWLIASGTSRIEGALSLFRSESKRAEFNKLVTNAIETGKRSEFDGVNKAVDKVKATIDDIFKEMQEAGIKDIEEVKKLKNYVPRMVRADNVSNLLRSLDTKSKELFINEFAKMLTKTDNPKDVARVYLDAISAYKSNSKKGITSVEQIRELLKKNKLDENMADDLADILGVGTNSFNRLKHRIPMDKSKFKELSLFDESGNPVKVDVEQIFETDIMNIMSQYTNQASGHIAFADLGYKSIDDAMEMAHTHAPNDNALQTIINDINLLSGKPVVDYSDMSNRVWRDISNYTMAKAMVFSTISLTQEALTTAARLNSTGWSETFKQLSKGMINTHGRDSMLVNRLKNLTGVGMHQYGKTFGAYKTIDDVGNVAGGEKALGFLSKAGEISRDFVLHVLPFVKTSDMLTAINLVDTAQLLADIKAGKVVLKEYENITYGITPEFKSLLNRKSFKLNSKGKVMDIDLDNWSREDRIMFGNVVDNIMQKRIQQPTFGTTGAYTRQSALGGTVSTLIKFPMSAYSNHGSFLGRGIFNGDAKAMIQSTIWFAGGALAASIRNELKGVEYDEEDLLMDSVTSHPFAGVYGTALGLANPAPIGFTSATADALNIYNYK